jgi:hypothetical protein
LSEAEAARGGGLLPGAAAGPSAAAAAAAGGAGAAAAEAGGSPAAGRLGAAAAAAAAGVAAGFRAGAALAPDAAAAALAAARMAAAAAGALCAGLLGAAAAAAPRLVLAEAARRRGWGAAAAEAALLTPVAGRACRGAAEDVGGAGRGREAPEVEGLAAAGLGLLAAVDRAFGEREGSLLMPCCWALQAAALPGCVALLLEYCCSGFVVGAGVAASSSRSKNRSRKSLKPCSSMKGACCGRRQMGDAIADSGQHAAIGVQWSAAVRQHEINHHLERRPGRRGVPLERVHRLIPAGLAGAVQGQERQVYTILRAATCINPFAQRPGYI